MYHVYTPEQIRLLAQTHRNDLAEAYGSHGPPRLRPFVAAILRRVANRLDRAVEPVGERGRPIRVLRLPTAELGNDRFIDVVIS